MSPTRLSRGITSFRNQATQSAVMRYVHKFAKPISATLAEELCPEAKHALRIGVYPSAHQWLRAIQTQADCLRQAPQSGIA